MQILPNDGNFGLISPLDTGDTGWIPPSQGGGGGVIFGGGGGNGGGPPLIEFDPAQAPPAWVVGSYAGTRGNGEQISFSIDASGHCVGLNDGNPFSGYYGGGLLTINGTSSQLVQTAAGLDTIRTDTGETTHYARSTSIVPAGSIGSSGTGTTAGGGSATGSTGTGTTAVGGAVGSPAAGSTAAPATILGMSPTTLLLLGAGVVAVLILTGGKDK